MSFNGNSYFRNEKFEKRNLEFPNALVIGAKKGGTGALLEMLSMHSQIQAVSGEANFFDREFYRGFVQETMIIYPCFLNISIFTNY